MWGGNGLKWKFSLQIISELTRKERQRSHPSHATNPDRRSTSTSNCTQIAPFNFAGEPRGQDHTPLTSLVNPEARIACLRLRWLRTPSALPRWHRSHWDRNWEIVGFWWIWPDLMNFFWLGFVSVFIYWKMVL